MSPRPRKVPTTGEVAEVTHVEGKHFVMVYVEDKLGKDIAWLKQEVVGHVVEGDAVGATYVLTPLRAPELLAAKASPSPRIGAVKVAGDAAEVYDVRPKLDNAIRALGNNTVADLLGVSRSQPGRWSRGEEGISAENQAVILDLDFVLSMLLRTMPPSLAGIWLVSPNEFLNGARPVDVFRLDGHRLVVEAIQAYAEGAFA